MFLSVGYTIQNNDKINPPENRAHCCLIGYTIQNNNKTNFRNNFNAISVVGYTIQNNNKTNEEAALYLR